MKTFLTPFVEDMIQQISDQGFWLGEKVLPENLSQLFYQQATERFESKEFRKAQISKGVLKKHQANVRSDLIYWLSESDLMELPAVNDLFSELLIFSRQKLFMLAKRFECFFAVYPKGASYVRHKDRHHKMPARLLTVVIYLNSMTPEQGGELVIESLKGVTTQILPQQGNIVVFDSALSHEVKVCNGKRWSLTGWIREDLHPSLRLQ